MFSIQKYNFSVAFSDLLSRVHVVLSNGNFVISDPYYDEGATADVGAVYLYDGITKALISTLKGSAESDYVGSNGITVLSNGNYVVSSPSWNGTKGAVTWANGSTGIAGIVSDANSLVGNTANDNVGADGIEVLSNGNYVVKSSSWNSARGAVTWANGSTGIAGIVSDANSLVGNTANDNVGSNGITVLSNGNYVVSSPYWNDARGAVTWGNGSTGIAGIVIDANSLVGGIANDLVGGSGITVLNNGNYVVRSLNWNGYTGAVTWGSGNTGIVGVVSNANSLVGSTTYDFVGADGIEVLSNGNYVVKSQSWNDNKGAVTWGNGSTGSTGIISIANSLVGSTAYDNVGGSGITVLNNGHYVVSTINWNGYKGAVTWGNGNTGIAGIVSDANSLVGSTAGDYVGINGITALSNGNYVVSSMYWNDGRGAVTWGNSSTGVAGFVSDANSLVGGSAGNNIGSDGITVLNNGNYVVRSLNWNSYTGAVTWGNGNTGISGIVSDANSLVGSTVNDNVGGYQIAVLSNGNYVVRSPYLNKGAVTAVGAITWANGSTGIAGIVSDANSLVGSTANDNVGYNEIEALSNGNYVVRSTYWDNGTVTDAGAAILANGTMALLGTINNTNSVMGTITGEVSYTVYNNIRNYLIVKRYLSNKVTIFSAAEAQISLKQATTAIAHSTGTHSFGNVNVNSNSGDITFTIKNTGNATLNLTSLQINGTNANMFSNIWTNANLAPNGNTTFSLKFSPTSAGNKTAFITIGNNTSVNPYTFIVNGTGLALTTATQQTTPSTTPTNNQIIVPVVVQNVVLNGQNVPIAPAGQATTFLTAQPLLFASQLDFKLPNGFTIVPFEANKANVSNGKITLNAVGQIKLTIIKADGTFSQIILNVEKANTWITANANTTASVGNLTCQSPAFALPFASNSPEKINLSVIFGKAEIQNNLIKVLGTGLVKIRATQAENNNFTSAQSFDFDFNVNKTARTFSLPNLTSKTFGDADFTLPNDWNNEKLTYSSESKNISISGNTVKILGAGQAVIKAVLAENDCYFANTFDLLLNVNKASQTVNLTKIVDQRIGNANVILNANASSNLPITFQVIEGQNLVSLQGNSLKINGIGKFRILASQAGNENYLPAQAEQNFEIFNDPSIRITNANLANKNENLVIDFVTTGIFSQNNDFTVFLSNSNGIFEGFVQQISFNGNSGRISMAVPSQILKSGNYRVQIRATNPNVLSNTFELKRVLTPKPKTPVLTRLALVICAEANVSGKYQWYANGKLLPNETNRCITISLSHGGRTEANQTMIYTVIVIDEEGRESEISSPVEITSDQINLITGIESDLEQNPIRVYPNPVKDRLVLDLTSKFLRKIEISVFNMLGQKVFEKSFANSEKEEVLDLNHLSAGTYLLEILSEKGKHRQQIVKE